MENSLLKGVLIFQVNLIELNKHHSSIESHYPNTRQPHGLYCSRKLLCSQTHIVFGRILSRISHSTHQSIGTLEKGIGEPEQAVRILWQIFCRIHLDTMLGYQEDIDKLYRSLRKSCHHTMCR